MAKIQSYAEELAKLKAEMQDHRNNVKHPILLDYHSRSFAETQKAEKIENFLADKVDAAFGSAFYRATHKNELDLDKSFYWRVLRKVGELQKAYKQQQQFFKYKEQYVYYWYIRELANKVWWFLKENPKLQNMPIHYKRFKDAIQKQFPEIYLDASGGFIELTSRRNHLISLTMTKSYIALEDRADGNYRFLPKFFEQDKFANQLEQIPYDVDIDAKINELIKTLPEIEKKADALQKEINTELANLDVYKFNFSHSREYSVRVPTL